MEAAAATSSTVGALPLRWRSSRVLAIRALRVRSFCRTRPVRS